jgi:hypothetical protein
MKIKLYVIVIVIVSAVLCNACGFNRALMINNNHNNTQVVLSLNNYKVLERVMGSSSVSYVLEFGGLNKKQLYEKAYSEMVTRANLMNSSKALINIVTEEHIGGFPPFYCKGYPPIYYKKTITVSATVIEFIK